jgi:hypothetical protein
VAGSEGVESGILEHTPEAIASWAGLLYQRFRGKPVAICLESDARLQLELLIKHRDRLKPLVPSSPAIQALELLIEHRRHLVGDKVRLMSRLTSVLKCYYPQVLAWFEDRGTTLFRDFLGRWPTLDAVQRARSSTIKHFFYEHHVRSATLIKRRLDGIKIAKPLTTHESIIDPNRLLTQVLLTQLRETLAEILPI